MASDEGGLKTTVKKTFRHTIQAYCTTHKTLITTHRFYFCAQTDKAIYRQENVTMLLRRHEIMMFKMRQSNRQILCIVKSCLVEQKSHEFQYIRLEFICCIVQLLVSLTDLPYR